MKDQLRQQDAVVKRLTEERDKLAKETSSEREDLLARLKVVRAGSLRRTVLSLIIVLPWHIRTRRKLETLWSKRSEKLNEL